MKIHIVKRGETLTKIAKKYNIGLEKLEEINSHIKDGDKITAGTKVKVPTAGVPLKAKESTKEAIPVSDRVEVQPTIPQIFGQSTQPQMIPTPTPPLTQAAPEIPEMPSYEYPPKMTLPEMMGMPQPQMMPPMGQPPMMQPQMMPPMGQPPMMQAQMMPPMGQPPMMQPQMMPPVGQPPMMQAQMMPPMGQPPMMQPQIMPPMGQPPMMQPQMMPSMGQPSMIQPPEFTPEMAGPNMMPPNMVSPGMMGMPFPEMYPPYPQAHSCKPCQETPQYPPTPYPFPGISPYGMNPTMLSPMQMGPFPGPEVEAPYNKNFFTQTHYPNQYHEQLYMTQATEDHDCEQEYMPPSYPGAVSPYMMPSMPQMMHPHHHMHQMYVYPPVGGHGPEMWECKESDESSSC